MARQRFEGVFARIGSELIDHISAQGMPQEAIQWYSNVRTFQLPHTHTVYLPCTESQL